MTLPLATPAPRRLPPLLRKAWYGLNQTFRQRITHLGITPDQFSILRWLHEGDPKGLTQSELTHLMASDPNTITSTLSRMEAARLVSRHPHETDRRARRVRIEPTGEQAFLAARQVAQQLQEQILNALPAKRRDAFLQDLAIVAETCGGL
jgi:DNA-binding MarR family transcriptional regulator